MGTDGRQHGTAGTFEALLTVPPFDAADAADLAAVAGSIEVVAAPAREVVVSQGQPADAVLVVVDGELDVILEDENGTRQHLARLGPGDVIGEVAVIAGGRRTATVVAVTDAQLVRIAAAGALDLVERVPAVATGLTELARRRLRETQLVEHLVTAFPELDPAAAAEVRAGLEWRSVPAGQVLFRQGDEGDAAYICVSGRLRVVVEHDEEPAEIVGEVGRGELVGEMALLDGGGRTATVYAVRDTELARLPRRVFESLLERYPRGMLEVARTVLARTRRTAAAPWSAEDTIALVPVHDSVDLPVLAEALTRELQGVAPTALLDRHRVDRELGRDGIAESREGEPGSLRLGQWMEEVSAEHRYLLLVADPLDSPWTRRVVRQADHVVVVADATQAPDPTPIERIVAELSDHPEHRRRRSLVLVHPTDADLPRGTAAWLDVREVDQHLHLRLGHGRDLGRVARHLAGRAVAVALSGGGARGYGHVGVARAMREHDVPMDLIVGTSMGCAIGTILAMDHPDASVEAAAVERAFDDVLDYTLPVAGLVKGGRIARSAARTVDDRDLEDLWIPFLGVTTNLTTSQVCVHRRGPVARVVRASVAIPGVIPPVAFGDDLHVDGGVLNNLPMDVARREVRAGTVLAVDVAPPRGPTARDDPGMSVSGWEILAKRLLPGQRPPRVPGIATTVMRSMIAASTRERDRALRAGIADAYVPLDMRGLGLLEFDAVRQAVEAGYQAAQGPVAELARRLAPVEDATSTRP